jgi:transposase
MFYVLVVLFASLSLASRRAHTKLSFVLNLYDQNDVFERKWEEEARLE